MQTPQYLKQGDTVAIISTARKITETEIEPAINILTSWGLNVIKGKHLHAEYHQFAGTEAQRLSEMQEMLDNKDVKAIFCARGGYGTVQIIDKINWSLFCKNPKWIVGYSDITVIHNHIQNNFGIESLHATMPINFSKKKENKQSILTLKSALFTGTNEYIFNNHGLNKYGKTEGEIEGGNMSLIYSLLGSPSDINTKDKILFIEDLDEYLYHIDRMMINIKRNNKFKYLKALVVGGMTKMNDNIIPYGKTVEEIIIENTADYDFPICFNFPAGHIEDNRAIIMGRNTILEIDSESSRFIQKK